MDLLAPETEIRSNYLGEMIRYHLKTDTESSLRNIVF
jgi:hypothetical protein